MKKEKFESGQIIVDFSRIFADAMEECLKNSGLLEDGYKLMVIVQNEWMRPNMDRPISCTIDLESPDNDCRKSFVMHKSNSKGWENIAKPKCDDDGTVSPEISSFEKAARVFKAGKKAEKPFAPDGLWLSSRDDYCDVDCRGAVK